MNVPIVSSAGTSFVLSQPTMSPHSQMAPPESPATSTAQQMSMSTPPHVASPHMASSPVPPSAGTSIQFSQGTVMSQSPTVIQTMAQGGTTLQFPSQMPVLQQGTLSPAGYLQPLYQTTSTGQQQMLLSPASSLAIQQQLGQGQITVMAGHQAQNTSQKGGQDGQGKTILTGVGPGQQNKGGQVMTSQGGTVSTVGGKMTMTTSNIMANITGAHKGNQGQIMTGVAPQAQFVTQTGGNGQTLLISPLGMLGTQGGMVGSMGGMLQTHSPQGQVGKAGQGQQTQVAHKFLPAGQQKGTHSPLQLTGLPPGTQYRHLSPAGQQQLITGQVGVGQPVLGQAQTILGSLQTFNAFGSGLSWAPGQLSGQPLLQSPILIRNQADGSVYIQSAPAAPHAQQQHQLQQTTATTVQVQQQQLQNATGTLSGPTGVSTVQQMQAGVTGTVVQGTMMHTGTVPTLMQQQQQQSAQASQQSPSQQTPTLGQTPPPGQPAGPQQINQHATVQTAVPPPAASPSQTQHGTFQPMQHLSVQANGQVVTTAQGPMQAVVAPRVQRPITPQQPSANTPVGVKVSTASRNVRGIAARPATMSGSAAGTATPPNSQPPTPGPPLTPTPSPDAENIKNHSPAQPGSLAEDKKQDIIVMDTSSLGKSATAETDSKSAITTINITENQMSGPLIGSTVGVGSSAALTQKDTGSNEALPSGAAIQNLELVQQPITTVPVVTLPDMPDVSEGNSASPAIGAPFPEEAGNVPDTIEQASEILTHIIEGYVIRESSEPFPVSRSALLSEMIRREQVCATSKERKRKLENNNNANKSVTATTETISTTGTVTTTSTSVTIATSSAGCTVNSGTAAAAAAANLGLGIDQLGLDNGSKAGATDPGKDNNKKDEEATVNQKTTETASENRTNQSGHTAAIGSVQSEVAAVAGASDTTASAGFSRNPSEWNVQDVYDFIKSVPGCAAYAEEFRVQEIDGEALIFLSTERHLMSQMNMKVGPAAKIYARLAQLRSDANLS